MTEKSRNIPLSELYSNLQLEYISYFLRSKIYCKDYSETYKKICIAKKEKIDKISNNNGLPSIFNNPSAKQRYMERFLNKTGLPNFTYKDLVIKNKIHCWDKHYFFQKGSSVKFVIDGETLIGGVTYNDKFKGTVSLIDESGNERQLHYNNITRIFSEEFFQF